MNSNLDSESQKVIEEFKTFLDKNWEHLLIGKAVGKLIRDAETNIEGKN